MATKMLSQLLGRGGPLHTLLLLIVAGSLGLSAASCVLDWERGAADGGGPDRSLPDQQVDHGPVDIIKADQAIKDSSPPKPPLWAHTMSVTESAITWVVASDKGSSLYVAGQFAGTLSYTINKQAMKVTSAGKNDLLVAKYSPAGALLWVTTVGDKGEDRAKEIITGGNGLYVAGYFTGKVDFGGQAKGVKGAYDAYVMRLDRQTGKLVWVTAMGSTGADDCTGLAYSTADGGTLWAVGKMGQTGAICGVKREVKPVNHYDAWVARLTADKGQCKSALFAGGTAHETPTGVVLAPGGDAYITGTFGKKDVSAFKSTFGGTVLTGVKQMDIFVARVAAAGTSFKWAVSGGGAGSEESRNVLADAAGEIYITGFHTGAATFGSHTLSQAGKANLMLVKLSSAGKFLWARSSASAATGEQVGFTTALTSANHLLVSGYYSQKTTFTGGGKSVTLPFTGVRDAYVARYDLNGKLLAAVKAGGDGWDHAEGVVALGTTMVVTGVFSGNGKFGGLPLKSPKSSLFVWRGMLP